VPKDAARYWGGAVFDVSRVTGRHHWSGSGPANQSLRGALMRFFPDASHISVIWLPCCVVVACLGLVLAVRAAGRGEELYGFLLIAITGLLVSPVSWTHHWSIVVLGALAAVTSTQDRGTRRLLIAVAIELAMASSAIWLIIDNDPVGMHLTAGDLLLANDYVIVGLGVIVVATVVELQQIATARRLRARGGRSRGPLRVILEGFSGS
jgi:alpha-1,2-mannosyltransferase